MQRVKSVLNYKKPAFWVVLVSVLACLVVAVCFLTTSPKAYQIKVKIPAGGTENFYYSDEEISPKGDTLIIYAGEGMGDGEIKLLPVGVMGENAYDKPIYITPGMPVKIKVKKGAWFKIGVNTMQNPSGEDMEVYLSVENVEVRIASKEGAEAQEIQEKSISGIEAEEAGQDMASANLNNLNNPDNPDDASDSNAMDEIMPPEPVFPIELLFASGASSAGTTLTLNQDGSFSGQHFDHENARDDDYPNGTCYICDFTGQFEDMRQINAYTYSMTLGEIVTEREEGEEWIEDGVLYIGAEPFGLEDGKEFLLYLPGTPLDELSEEFLSWWMGWWSYQNEMENPQIMPCYGLLNVATGKGFFDYE